MRNTIRAHKRCGSGRKLEYFDTSLTHWDRVTYKCVSKQTTTSSDNGLSPDRRQAIIWTNVGILLIVPLGTNFSEILIEIYTFSFNKMHLKMSSGQCLPFCLGLNVLKMYRWWNEFGVIRGVIRQKIGLSCSHMRRVTDWLNSVHCS